MVAHAVHVMGFTLHCFGGIYVLQNGVFKSVTSLCYLPTGDAETDCSSILTLLNTFLPADMHTLKNLVAVTQTFMTVVCACLTACSFTQWGPLLSAPLGILMMSELMHNVVKCKKCQL